VFTTVCILYDHSVTLSIHAAGPPCENRFAVRDHGDSRVDRGDSRWRFSGEMVSNGSLEASHILVFRLELFRIVAAYEA
jgi:hypothetical protein